VFAVCVTVRMLCFLLITVICLIGILMFTLIIRMFLRCLSFRRLRICSLFVFVVFLCVILRLVRRWLRMFIVYFVCFVGVSSLLLCLLLRLFVVFICVICVVHVDFICRRVLIIIMCFIVHICCLILLSSS